MAGANSRRIFHDQSHSGPDRTKNQHYGAPRDGGKRKHAGVDYSAARGTFQYSPFDGGVVKKIVNTSTSARGLYAQIYYPSIGKGLILQHADTVEVKNVGDIVNKDTVLVTTGGSGVNPGGGSYPVHAHVEFFDWDGVRSHTPYDTYDWEIINLEQYDVETLAREDIIQMTKETLKETTDTATTEGMQEAWNWAREKKLVLEDTPQAVSNREEVIAMIMRSLEMKEMKGSGTRQDPYQIRTEEHLRAVVPGKYYEMMNDITLSGTENNWTPIGAGRNGFTGQFDGGGHTIRNIQIDTDEDDQGFFGSAGSGAAAGRIKNLNIKDSSIKGKNKVGGIVGNAIDAQIHGCSFEGSVTATGGTAGGIAGYLQTGTGFMEDCYNKGTVSGSVNAGGIAGEAYVSFVMNCHNEGDVYAGGIAGGIVGTNFVDLSQCLNTGNIFSMNTDTGSAGGIAGDERVESSSCVSAGSIVSSANADSAFRISPASSSGSNYALESMLVNGSTVSGTKDSVHGQDITAEQIASPEFYQTNLRYWDFDNTWMIDPVKGHPVLRWAYE